MIGLAIEMELILTDRHLTQRLSKYMRYSIATHLTKPRYSVPYIPHPGGQESEEPVEPREPRHASVRDLRPVKIQ